MLSSGIPLVFAAVTGLLAAEPTGIYLPPSETGGSEFQFNPASPDLRQAAKKREPRPDDLLDARAVADDLVFLRRALRKQYIGYPELLQLPDFDVEALFDQHIARLRSGPAKVKFADSLRALFLELKSHINDGHFNMGGVDRDPLQGVRRVPDRYRRAGAGTEGVYGAPGVTHDPAGCAPADSRRETRPVVDGVGDPAGRHTGTGLW